MPGRAPLPPSQIGPAAAAWRSLLPEFLLLSVLWLTFVLKLHNLDHTALTRWDESFHAVVAQNVFKHPLQPTLIDVPYLPYDNTQWNETHIWLHKPILPFWQVALSFALLGVNPLALRLPAAVLSTAAAWLTYLIGKELFDRRTAVLAAVLQALNPFIVRLVQGYQFADNIDIALLFWVEVGVYFVTRALRTGAWRNILLAGLAQGLAYLCKSYLAAIVFGIALTAWLLPIVRLAKHEDVRIRFVHLLGLLAAGLVTVAPWMIYCAVAYPVEFWHEHAEVWRHLYANVEYWAAPWDRLTFDYLVAIYGLFYTPILVAAIMLAGRAIRGQQLGLTLIYAWGLGVLVPLHFAVTKTPSATLLAVPALLLLVSYFIVEACSGRHALLTALTAIVALSVVFPGTINNPGHGYPGGGRFAGVLQQRWWVIGHVAGALAVTALVLAIGSLATPERLRRHLPRLALGLSIAGLTWLAAQTVFAAWLVTNADVNDPASVEAGSFARQQLAENSVLLCEEREGGEHRTVMFYADRTCYPLRFGVLDAIARQVVAAGGIPYIVTRRSLPLPAIWTGRDSAIRVYRWQPR